MGRDHGGRTPAGRRTAAASPSRATAHVPLARSGERDVLELQRAAGNRAVASMLSGGGGLTVQRFAVQSIGARNRLVRQIQRKLNAAGASPRLRADGIFGPRTEAAVKQFQRLVRLKPTGVVTPQTWDLLERGGRGSATSPVAMLARGVLHTVLLGLAMSLLRGARALETSPSPDKARVVARKVAMRARALARYAARIITLNPAVAARARRQSNTMLLVSVLTEFMPSAGQADPRAFAVLLRALGARLVGASAQLAALSPEAYAEVAPQIVQLTNHLLVALTPYLGGGGLSQPAPGTASSPAQPSATP